MTITTIAYRDGVLATDSATTAEDVYSGSVRKLARLEDGSLAAFAGRSISCHALLAWFEHGGEKPEFEADEACGVVVKPNGVVHVIDGTARLAPVECAFFAMGTGRAIALGAMAAGASAEEAVRIATEFDVYSRGPVQAERL